MLKKLLARINKEYFYTLVVLSLSALISILFIFAYHSSRVMPVFYNMSNDVPVIQNNDGTHFSYLDQLNYDGESIIAVGWTAALDETRVTDIGNGVQQDTYLNVAFLLKDENSNYYKLTTIVEDHSGISELLATGHNFDNRGFSAKALSENLPRGNYQGHLLLTLSNQQSYLFEYDKTITI